MQGAAFPFLPPNFVLNMRESKHILTFFFAGTKKGRTFAAGEMAERSNAAVLKTVVRLSADRGSNPSFSALGKSKKKGLLPILLPGVQTKEQSSL